MRQDRREALEYRMRRDSHTLAGRISGSAGIASFCSCGLAFFGSDVLDADSQRRAHEYDAYNKSTTSRYR